MGGALVSGVVAIVVHQATRLRFVSCEQCRERHTVVDKRLDDADKRDSKQFSLLKALITYSSDIPTEEKAKLLNEGGN